LWLPVEAAGSQHGKHALRDIERVCPVVVGDVTVALSHAEDPANQCAVGHLGIMHKAGVDEHADHARHQLVGLDGAKNH
jgi:hypothetical protein